jgi:hypothetical protein
MLAAKQDAAEMVRVHGSGADEAAMAHVRELHTKGEDESARRFKFVAEMIAVIEREASPDGDLAPSLMLLPSKPVGSFQI